MMRRFLDFLFEKEDEFEQVNESSEPVFVNEPINVQEQIKTSTTSEKPILETDSVNINEKKSLAEVDHILLEVPNKPIEKKKKTTTKTYVFTESISPIFGMKEKKAEEIKVTSGKKVISQRLNTSKIGTILSPIYGVDVFDDVSEDKLINEPENKKDVTNLNELPTSIKNGFVQESLFTSEDAQDEEYVDNKTLASLIQTNENEGVKKVINLDLIEKDKKI